MKREEFDDDVTGKSILLTPLAGYSMLFPKK